MRSAQKYHFMADPFSIIAASAGLADVSLRFANLLKQSIDGFRRLGEDLDELSREVEGIQAVNELVERAYEAGLAISTDSNDQQIVLNHWHAIETTLAGCKRIIEQMSSLLLQVLSIGKGKHPRHDNLRKYLCQQSKEGEFIKLRQKLSAHQVALSTSLAGINVFGFIRFLGLATGC